MYPAALIRLLLLSCVIPLLVACATAPAPGQAGGNDRQGSGPSGTLVQRQLQLAQSSISPQREEHLLNALELLIYDALVDEAQEMAAGIDAQSLSLPRQRLRFALLQAELALQQGEGEPALTLLNEALPEPDPGMDLAIQQRIISLRAQAQLERQRHVAAVQELLLLAQLLEPQQRSANNNRIWEILSNAADGRLELPGAQASYELRGWLELVEVFNANQNDIARQIEAVDRWRSKWVRHSASIELPESLLYVRELWDNRARQVALLIPLEEPAGKAVSEGFMAAYYDALAREQEVPQVTVYDTSDMVDVMPIYRQAVEDGADLIIGPLRKDSVRQLQSQRRLAVPTLALNYGDAERISPPRFYQFGLAPEDEILQAAEMAWQAGHRQAALLTPAGGEYQRIRETFMNYWQNLGGELVSQAQFSASSAYSEVVRDLMSIHASELRAERLRELLPRNTLHFTPRRRQDIDFIFLLASPVEGRQIKPTLAFHYAGDVPVYAMPGIYDGGANEVANRDLNGVIFTDAPWMLQGNPLQQSLNAVMPAAASNVQRLRAMGVDAFRLHARLGQLESFPATRIQGVTGTLSMLSSGAIKRELLPARFVNGQAQLAAAPLSSPSATVALVPRP